MSLELTMGGRMIGGEAAVAFFEYVAEHIEGFEKEKTLIVGDSLSSDIAGGINFGIDTCWYSPSNMHTKANPTYIVDSMEKVLPIALAEDEDE